MIKEHEIITLRQEFATCFLHLNTGCDLSNHSSNQVFLASSLKCWKSPLIANLTALSVNSESSKKSHTHRIEVVTRSGPGASGPMGGILIMDSFSFFLVKTYFLEEHFYNDCLL